MKTYICTKCNERIVETQVVMDYDPGTWNSPMRELLESMDENRRKDKPIEPYHTAHCYAQWGGTQRMVLCGPLRLSDEGDEHIHWLDQCAMNSKCVK